jgi:hypothetical protein
MVQGRCGTRFGRKTAKPLGVVSGLRRQSFNGNGSIQSSVKSAKDDPHPPAPHLSRHLVSAIYEIAQHRFSTRLLFLALGSSSGLARYRSWKRPIPSSHIHELHLFSPPRYQDSSFPRDKSATLS